MWKSLFLSACAGASDEPVQFFLNWTVLIAAFLTPVEQTRVIPWLYTVVRTLRRFQTSVTIEIIVQNAGFLTSADKPGA
jgi:hypothetical protein